MNPPELGFLLATDGEPVFGEPWHAQTLAMADLLVRGGVISPARWAETLGAEIEALKAAPDERETYYRAVLAALERVLAETGSVTDAELDEREHQWERAYARTPHGEPVELAAGLEPDAPSGRGGSDLARGKYNSRSSSMQVKPNNRGLNGPKS